MSASGVLLTSEEVAELTERVLEHTGPARSPGAEVPLKRCVEQLSTQAVPAEVIPAAVADLPRGREQRLPAGCGETPTFARGLQLATLAGSRQSVDSQRSTSGRWGVALAGLGIACFSLGP